MIGDAQYLADGIDSNALDHSVCWSSQDRLPCSSACKCARYDNLHDAGVWPANIRGTAPFVQVHVHAIDATWALGWAYSNLRNDW